MKMKILLTIPMMTLLLLSSCGNEPVDEHLIHVEFEEVDDNVLVSPKVKEYVDAMKEQEETIEDKYHISDLYGENGVDVCKMLNSNDYNGTNKPQQINIKWSSGIEYEDAVIRYSTNADMSDYFEVEASSNSVSLDNLYRNTTYYYQLIYGEDHSQIETFTTADYVRMINLGDVYNVRDLGGYMTSYGKRTRQGLIYRGSEIVPETFNNNGEHKKNVDEFVLQVQNDVLKIGTELDFRSAKESNNLTSSALGEDVEYARYSIGSYHNYINNPQYIKEIFEILANADNSHVYFHCWGGADRTGTIAFLLNAICGVSYTDLVMDFEYTTETNSNRCHMHEVQYAYFSQLINAFTKLPYYDASKSVNENACAFLMANGVSQETIETIRSIMIEDYEPSILI